MRSLLIPGWNMLGMYGTVVVQVFCEGSIPTRIRFTETADPYWDDEGRVLYFENAEGFNPKDVLGDISRRSPHWCSIGEAVSRTDYEMEAPLVLLAEQPTHLIRFEPVYPEGFPEWETIWPIRKDGSNGYTLAEWIGGRIHSAWSEDQTQTWKHFGKPTPFGSPGKITVSSLGAQ